MDLASHKKPSSHTHNKPQPTTSDLLSSAKVVAGAAQSSLRHETDKIDKGRVAGAAADLLGAAAHYGKVEEKSFGKYVEKAEDYLHQYHSSHSAHSTTTHSSSTHSGGEAPSAAAAGGGGYGEYMKMAQGLLNTHSSGSSGGGGGAAHSEGGGYGEYIKMAEGFLKKH